MKKDDHETKARKAERGPEPLRQVRTVRKARDLDNTQFFKTDCVTHCK
jgi:hypothetical protein